MAEKGIAPVPENLTPAQPALREDLSKLCTRIDVSTNTGVIVKTGYICSKEKMAKLLALDGIDVIEKEVEAFPKLGALNIYGTVDTNKRVVVFVLKETSTTQNNKEEKKMEENKNNNAAETKNTNTATTPAPEAAATTATAVAAAPAAVELPPPSPQALANAEAMKKALIEAKQEMQEMDDSYGVQILKAVGIGAATAVGVVGVCALYNAIFGE